MLNAFCIFHLFLTSKIDPKIDAKSYPEGAWGDLRGLPEASRRPPGLVFGRNSPWMRIMSDFVNFLGRPGTALGTPGEPKNSLKIDFLLKKRRSKRVFSPIFVHRACFHAFNTIFRRFFSKNRWKINEKNDAFFRIVACFFQHGDPHETLYFTIRKLLFHFSRFCVFSKKNVKTRAPKSRPRFSLKNHPKVVPGDPFWTQNGPELTSGRWKNRKMWQKSRFWTQ